MRILLMVLEVLVSLGLMAVILLQSGHSAGISGAIAGGAETLFGRKKGLDEFLARITVYLAAAFLVVSLLLALV